MIMGETAQTLTRAAAASLKAAGVATAPLDARVMMRHVLGLKFEDALVDPARRLTVEEERRFSALLHRREKREPLSHILGRKEFWSLPFLVGPDVLDPRPDSETVIEIVLGHLQSRDQADGRGLKILDLGTGSGCLLLALLQELPGATGVGSDLSHAALAIARRNAARLGVGSRARLVESDWTAGIDGQFDVIVSNPPYIPSAGIVALAPEIRDHEPRLALDGGPDGLDPYRRILPGLARFCGPRALVVFEVGEGQSDEVAKLLIQNGFADVAAHDDLARIARCVSGVATGSQQSKIQAGLKLPVGKAGHSG
jgi:release factor glutamine methyltransferase